MDISALHEPRTETITFAPLKCQRDQAKLMIDATAKVFALQIEQIAERPRRISTELRITVTGDPFEIADFKAALNGKGDQDGSDRWFDAVLGFLGGLASDFASWFSW